MWTQSEEFPIRNTAIENNQPSQHASCGAIGFGLVGGGIGYFTYGFTLEGLSTHTNHTNKQ